MPTNPYRAAAALLIAAAALTATGCSSNGQSFTDWYSQGGRTHITALTEDARAMGNATDLETDAKACTSGVEHAQAAKAYPPIPDTTAQQHWARMLELFGQAARDCKAGAESSDAALLRTSASELEQTLTESSVLEARLRELGAAE
jgi:hypothetical protein